MSGGKPDADSPAASSDMLLGRNGDVGRAADSRGVAGGRWQATSTVVRSANGGTLQRTSSVAQPLSMIPSSARFPCKPVGASPPHTWATAHQVPPIDY